MTEEILERLRALSNPQAVPQMARFGIRSRRALGVAVPDLRKIAREIGRDHKQAAALWKTGVHEARILAALTDDPDQVTREQMEAWSRKFDNWAIVDACCGNLFDRTPYAFRMAIEWSRREPEFIKRAGFVLMAELAVHDKRAKDAQFGPFFARIHAEAGDARNFVRKAVNWALRQIGKRNPALNQRAIALARELKARPEASARWIGSDALRELTSDAVKRRLARVLAKR